MLGHHLHVRGAQIQFRRDLTVRKVQSHQIKAHHPHPQRLVMTGQHRVRQIVETSMTGLAERTLPMRLCLVTAIAVDGRAVATGTAHAIRPAMLAHQFETLGIVQQRREVNQLGYGHDDSLLAQAAMPRQSSDQMPLIPAILFRDHHPETRQEPRWIASEFVTGSRAVMAKFDKYVPRPEPVEYGWGGYHVKVDRVEWRIITDPATAAGALATGEGDWVENPLPDLLPMLRKTSGVTVGRLDTHGVFPVLRPNFI